MGHRDLQTANIEVYSWKSTGPGLSKFDQFKSFQPVTKYVMDGGLWCFTVHDTSNAYVIGSLF